MSQRPRYDGCLCGDYDCADTFGRATKSQDRSRCCQYCGWFGCDVCGWTAQPIPPLPPGGEPR